MYTPATREPARGPDARIEAVLSGLAMRLAASAATRPGAILFRVTDALSVFALQCCSDGVRLQQVDARRPAAPPLIEISASARVLCAVVEQRKNPLKMFAVGRLRVRGDLRYLSHLGVALGVLDKPL